MVAFGHEIDNVNMVAYGFELLPSLLQFFYVSFTRKFIYAPSKYLVWVTKSVVTRIFLV